MTTPLHLIELWFYCIGFFWAATVWARGIINNNAEKMGIGGIAMGLWLGLIIQFIFYHISSK